MPVGSWIDVSGNIEVEAYTGQDGSVKHNLVLTVMDFEFMPKNATPTTGFLQTLVTANVGNDVTVKDITPKAGPYAGQTVPVAEARIAMTQSWKDKGDGSRKEKTVWAVGEVLRVLWLTRCWILPRANVRDCGCAALTRLYRRARRSGSVSGDHAAADHAAVGRPDETAPTVDEEAIPLEPEYMPAEL